MVEFINKEKFLSTCDKNINILKVKDLNKIILYYKNEMEWLEFKETQKNKYKYESGPLGQLEEIIYNADTENFIEYYFKNKKSMKSIWY